MFASLLKAKVPVEEYRKHFNERPPHSSFGLPDPGGACSIVQAGRYGLSLYEGFMMGNQALIVAGAETGCRSGWLSTKNLQKEKGEASGCSFIGSGGSR